MPEITQVILPLIVAVVAFLYSSVGFGGATGYLAAMSVIALEPQTMASTALILNVLVASIAFSNYTRAGHLEQRLLWPFLTTSIPAAFLGGALKLDDQAYTLLLYGVLTFVALRLLFFSNPGLELPGSYRRPKLLAAGLVGLGIGLLSGMVGIGGGIFLSPVIILARWGNSKQAAAVAAAFIVLNSVSGLAGRVFGGNFAFESFSLLLLPFGLVGAMAGSRLGAQRFSSRGLQRALGVVILIAVMRYFLL